MYGNNGNGRKRKQRKCVEEKGGREREQRTRDARRNAVRASKCGSQDAKNGMTNTASHTFALRAELELVVRVLAKCEEMT